MPLRISLIDSWRHISFEKKFEKYLKKFGS